MNDINIFILACVYLALGIPLLVYSFKLPEIENVSSLNIFDENDITKFLNYQKNAMIATDIGPWQRLICELQGKKSKSLQTGNPSNTVLPDRCNSILSSKTNFDFSDNSHHLNNLRLTGIIIGIVLCFWAFVTFIRALNPRVN